MSTSIFSKDSVCKLSILLYTKDAGQKLIQSLDSLFMQESNFNFEVIAINDNSKDNTLEILNDYKKKHIQITIVNNNQSLGRNLSYYQGLTLAQGKYFSLLDAGDFYSVRNVFKQHIDFLDADTKEEYAICAHHTVFIDKKHTIMAAPYFPKKDEYSYFEFLSTDFTHLPYAYLYRNIYKTNPCVLFKENNFDEDEIIRFFQLFSTKGKIKILNFCGSVKVSKKKSLITKDVLESEKKKKKENHKKLSSLLHSKKEKSYFALSYKEQDIESLSSFLKKYSHEEFLQQYIPFSTKSAYNEQDFIFSRIFVSEFYDSLSETVGTIEAVSRGYSLSNPMQTDSNKVMISVPALNPEGGGIFQEIKEIIELYHNKEVYLLLPEYASISDVSTKAQEILSVYSHCTFVFGKNHQCDWVKYLFDLVESIKPAKIYHYCGHHNLILATIIQSYLSKNICVFSYDHGQSLALTNSSYQTYITKRPIDYHMLKKQFSNRVIYIPLWAEKAQISRKYIPFNGHDKIITACAAARFYKLVQENESYIDVILLNLKANGTKHIHYGIIPPEYKEEIKNKMNALQIKPSQFINIEWASNLTQSLIENNVDLFIEPFPIISAKITLQILSVGIPLIIKKSNLRLGLVDFIYDKPLLWNNTEDFIHTIATLDKTKLTQHSQLSTDYFNSQHELNLTKQSFFNETSYLIPRDFACYDARLIYI